MEEKTLEKKVITKISVPKIYLFVCTGNTCRSPMAEAIFNRYYAVGDDRAASAGIFSDGSQISENARVALEKEGIKGFTHKSVTVDCEMMRRAEKVIGISASHADKLTFMFPEFAAKITALPIDIADPYGGDLAEYEKCLSDIRTALDQMFGKSEINHER